MRLFLRILPGIAVVCLSTLSASAGLSGSWAVESGAPAGHVRNLLWVESTSDWIDGQILVELTGAGSLYYTNSGIPTLDDLLNPLHGGSESFTRAGGQFEAINSAIDGLETVPNVGTGGAGGLGGGLGPTISSTTFDLTWYGPPTSQSDTGTLTLSQMTASTDAFGTWSLRLRNSLAGSGPAEVAYLNGYVYAGEFISGLPGDVNGDGVVDLGDFGILAYNFDLNATGKTFAQGDLNADGAVDNIDFGIQSFGFEGNINTSAAILSVPEPNISLIVLLSCAIMSRRHRYPTAVESRL